MAEPEVTEQAAPVKEPIVLAESVPVPASSPLDDLLQDPKLLASLLLPLLLIFFVFLRPKGGKGGRSLLIFGPVGGGKTALYHQMRHGRTIPTVSSMEPASGSFIISGSSTKVNAIDMPGSGRLRARLLEEASGAAALVCVLDGTQLAMQARDAAQVLFDVLSHDAVARRMPPLLVVVNKSDVPSCATPAAARKALEQEVPGSGSRVPQCRIRPARRSRQKARSPRITARAPSRSTAWDQQCSSRRHRRRSQTLLPWSTLPSSTPAEQQQMMRPAVVAAHLVRIISAALPDRSGTKTYVWHRAGTCRLAGRRGDGAAPTIRSPEREKVMHVMSSHIFSK